VKKNKLTSALVTTINQEEQNLSRNRVYLLPAALYAYNVSKHIKK
jgi:hypothetical protein